MDAANARKAINRLVDAFVDKHANSRGYMSQRELETEKDLETIRRFLDALDELVTEIQAIERIDSRYDA